MRIVVLCALLLALHSACGQENQRMTGKNSKKFPDPDRRRRSLFDFSACLTYSSSVMFDLHE
jgi:hypothetical protein